MNSVTAAGVSPRCDCDCPVAAFQPRVSVRCLLPGTCCVSPSAFVGKAAAPSLHGRHELPWALTARAPASPAAQGPAPALAQHFVRTPVAPRASAPCYYTGSASPGRSRARCGDQAAVFQATHTHTHTGVCQSHRRGVCSTQEAEFHISF